MDDETNTPPSQERLKAFLDQVLLRIFNASPGLSSYEESSRVTDDGAVEISFFTFPDEVVSAVEQSFSVGDLEILRYTKEGHPCIGFRARPTKDELSALAVDDGDEKHKDMHYRDDGEVENTTGVEAEANAMLAPPGQPSAT